MQSDGLSSRQYRIARGDYDWPRMKLVLFTEASVESENYVDAHRVEFRPQIVASKKLTENQKRILLRNGLIHLGHENGYSHRQLATALGMPHSQVAEVLKKPPCPVDGIIRSDTSNGC